MLMEELENVSGMEEDVVEKHDSGHVGAHSAPAAWRRLAQILLVDVLPQRLECAVAQLGQLLNAVDAVEVDLFGIGFNVDGRRRDAKCQEHGPQLVAQNVRCRVTARPLDNAKADVLGADKERHNGERVEQVGKLGANVAHDRCKHVFGHNVFTLSRNLRMTRCRWSAEVRIPRLLGGGECGSSVHGLGDSMVTVLLPDARKVAVNVVKNVLQWTMRDTGGDYVPVQLAAGGGREETWP